MTEEPKADFTLALAWTQGQQFTGTSEDISVTIDGKRQAGPSPVQAVAFGLAGCMAIDVVEVIEKGRLDLQALTCSMRVFRADEAPRAIRGVELHFVVTGAIPDDRVDRAIDLSREKYCSVWHSLNPSIDFRTSFTVNP